MRTAERLDQARAVLRDPTHAHRLELAVLGLRVRFESNSPAVLDVAAEAFAGWRHCQPISQGARPLYVRIAVRDATASPRKRVTHRSPDGIRLIARTADSVGISDPARGGAGAMVTRGLVEDRARFRHDMLEALTWALLTRFDRQPLHAAGLVRDGVALLLSGGSGMGKSTLTYAAARAGIGVLAEDTVFLQSRPYSRVWGKPGTVRLQPETAAQFPELVGAPAGYAHNGRHRVLARLDGQHTQVVAGDRDRCVVCILGERRQRAELLRLTGAEAMSRIDLLAPGFSMFAPTIRPVLERMTRAGAWLLHPEPSPTASVPLLQALLDDTRERQPNDQ